MKGRVFSQRARWQLWIDGAPEGSFEYFLLLSLRYEQLNVLSGSDLVDTDGQRLDRLWMGAGQLATIVSLASSTTR